MKTGQEQSKVKHIAIVVREIEAVTSRMAQSV